MKAAPPPVALWAPLASLWLAISILAAINGQLLLGCACTAGLATLAVMLRLDTLARQRYLVLHATVSLIDAKVTHLRRGSKVIG